MFGFTQQERRIVQLLLIALLVGLGVTAHKRSHFGKSWEESINFDQDSKEDKSRSKPESIVVNSSRYDDSLAFQSSDYSNTNAKSLSQFAAKININSATEEELELLPGIGPAFAKRIVEFRREYGKFKNIEAIKQVKGIGEKKFQKIRDLISIK